SMTTVGWPTQRSSPANANRPRQRSGSAPKRCSTSKSIEGKRVLTDNGSCYRSKLFAHTLGPTSPKRFPPLPPANQRQGRAIQLHPQPAMGLRPDLLLRSSPRSDLSEVVASLQPPQTPHRHRR